MNEKARSRILILTAIFAVVLTVCVFIVAVKLQNEIKESVQILQPQQILQKATLSIQPKSVDKAAVGTPSAFTVSASSKSQAVVGYDIVLKYDPKALSYVSYTNLMPADFQIYPKIEEGQIILTAIKSLSSKNASVFRNTALADLVFTPKKTGKTSLILISPRAKVRSTLVNDNSQNILNVVRSLSIEVK